MAKILSDPNQKILSKRGNAVVDARTNQLFVQDVPSRLEDVRRLLAKMDVPVRQVLIEARIVEANDTFSKNLGVRLGYSQSIPGGTRVFGQNNVRANVGGELNNTGQETLSPGGGQLVQGTPTLGPGDQQVNLPAPGLSGFVP